MSMLFHAKEMIYIFGYHYARVLLPLWTELYNSTLEAFPVTIFNGTTTALLNLQQEPEASDGVVVEQGYKGPRVGEDQNALSTKGIPESLVTPQARTIHYNQCNTNQWVFFS